jgi:hypothetical protein
VLGYEWHLQHTNLLGPFVSYKENEVFVNKAADLYQRADGKNSFSSFLSSLTLGQNKLERLTVDNIPDLAQYL